MEFALDNMYLLRPLVDENGIDVLVAGFTRQRRLCSFFGVREESAKEPQYKRGVVPQNSVHLPNLVYLVS